MFKGWVDAIKSLFPNQDTISLHTPTFTKEDEASVLQCLQSTYVSTTGPATLEFEQNIAEITGHQFAVAVNSGTSALHLALLALNIQPGDLVITQSLTFIATINAIRYCGAEPLFIDISEEYLSLSPKHLERFLNTATQMRNNTLIHTDSGRPIRACIPMHTLGMPADMMAIQTLCETYKLPIIEDAAEALGSRTNRGHVGCQSLAAVISFNGNKIITTGGGGVVLTQDERIANRVHHLSCTARLPHRWLITHNELGYNYRLPSLNAALGLGQLSRFTQIIHQKRQLHQHYQKIAQTLNTIIFSEPKSDLTSNHWLNAINLESYDQQQTFLHTTHSAHILTRPFWTPIHQLTPYQNNFNTELSTTESVAKRWVCLPSSAWATISS